MRTSHLCLAAAAICIPVLALQFLQNSKLRSEIIQLEEKIVDYRDGTHRQGGLSALSTDNEKGIDPTGSSALLADDANIDTDTGDIATDLAHILARRDPMQRMGALLAYVGRLSDAELPEALTQLRQSTPDWDPDARVAAQLMLTRWGKADPEGALAYAAGLGRDKAGRDATIILSAVAADDPQRAVKWLEDPDNKLVKQPWLGQFLAGSVTKEWVRQDPEAALEWAMNTPESQRSGAYSGVLGTIAATDPKRAATLASTLPEGDARNEIIGQIARAWSETSPVEAIQWASSLDDKERKRATNEALGKWAQSDPEEAADYVDQLADGDRIEGMLDRVASNWARQEPESAAMWLMDMDESADKADAMGDVMWNWTVADPEAASTWLLEQPEGNSRDEGIGALAKATFDKDPESAVTWAAHMSDETKRQWAVGVGVNVWLDRDPAAAREWLNDTDALSPEWIDGILDERTKRKAKEAGEEIPND